MPMRRGFLFLLFATAIWAAQPFYDRTHPSKVFGQDRHYRILLPPGYETTGKAYPVIYYFHGHSDRYTLEKYDNGKDTIPKMADFVSRNDSIVVAVDGYVARDYTGFYGGSPWDVREEGGDYDFGEYFKELVAHIDSTYRTLTDRRHRATSGLSMGGFMSLWLSARYPDLIGSASAFNPGPEFYAGGKGRRVLWRPKDHVSNHGHTMVRLIRASGDYISQYHEETHEAYARAPEVDYEYRRDEYHRHWATSIGETFRFHMRAFRSSSLDNVPEVWSHANPYRRFQVWGYEFFSEGEQPGTVYLEAVRQGGMRITTRRWAPDGPPAERRIRVLTAPLYRAGASYQLTDYNLTTKTVETSQIAPDDKGRLSFTVDGRGHQLSFTGPGTGSQPPVLLPLTRKEVLRLPPGEDIALPIRIYNPRSVPMTAVKAALSSQYPTVQILSGSGDIPKLEPGQAADLSPQMKVRFVAGTGYFTHARLELRLTYDGWQSAQENIDVLIAPETIPNPDAVEVLDGRTFTFNVFRQKGNQGGGASVQRTVTEGSGNGNGVLEPGETATIWVRMKQGMDPFDKNNWYRTKVYTDSHYVEEAADIQEQKQLEWTGAKERTSLIRLAPATPAGTSIPLLLDNESWSYHYTPDVRYGKEKLYQAFQLHTRHLHRIVLQIPKLRRR
ncbi:MAG: esterase family protein [Bryobacterales bacterium]|nr:esterase family protein [Bryobacterales bacterium]